MADHSDTMGDLPDLPDTPDTPESHMYERAECFPYAGFFELDF